MTERNWMVIVLAAGYGSRLTRDIEKDTSDKYCHLLGLPKGLLPVWGKPLLSHWLRLFQSLIKLEDIVVVTNNRFHSSFVSWAIDNGIPVDNVLDDGTTSNEGRLGAIADLSFAIHSKRDLIGSKNILVIASDTLFFHDFNLSTYLQSLHPHESGVTYYTVSDDEVSKRGILTVDDFGLVQSMIEKPADPLLLASRKACPAFYAYNNSVIPLMEQYLGGDVSLEMKDSPGRLIPHLLSQQHPIRAVQISGRFDIGSLHEYQLTNSVVAKTYARIGLMGNPSDGYNGKCISFTIDNFYASVSIHPASTDRNIAIIPHPVLDTNSYNDWSSFYSEVTARGLYGGLRLIYASCMAFLRLCKGNGISLDSLAACEVSYDCTIPRSVGLAGSSAIVLSTFRALQKFHHISLRQLGICELAVFPQIILDIERKELGIEGGLQDRVIQVYEGIMFMDFDKDFSDSHGFGDYHRLEMQDLPPNLFLLTLKPDFNKKGDSGKVHSTVKKRWLDGDENVRAGMIKLGELSLAAVDCLKQHKITQLCDLMDENFNTRRQMYGDAVIGELNLRAIEEARRLGFAAKFTGSGGAIICLLRPGELVPPDVSEIFGCIGYDVSLVRPKDHDV